MKYKSKCGSSDCDNDIYLNKPSRRCPALVCEDCLKEICNLLGMPYRREPRKEYPPIFAQDGPYDNGD